MNESVLVTIRRMLTGILYSGETAFDDELINHINMVMAILHRLGVGPKEGFRITSENEMWSDFLQTDEMLSEIQSYVYMKVKMIFDPPASSSASKAFESYIQELEWTIDNAVNYKKVEEAIPSE